MTSAKNNKKGKIGAESSAKTSSPDKKTPESLKPLRKIVKKSPYPESAETKEAKTSSQVQTRKKAKKKIIKGGTQESKKVDDGGGNPILNQGNEEQKIITEKSVDTSEWFKKRTVKKGGNQESKKVERDGGRNVILHQGNEEEKSTNKKNKERSMRYRKDEGNIGGLIFMCNAKTKPDCFRYQVMGFPTKKQEVVMGIKPGLKLFLYDFDLRLMYGIYKASSAGAMKLEPAAFGGAFPVQVRFKVHEDCLPLHESEFKKAIKENYNEKTHKFSVELTVQQVKKLTSLFQPVMWSHSNAQSSPRNPYPAPIVHLPPTTSTHVEEAHREHFTRDHHTISSNHERNRYSEHPTLPTDLASSDALFLSEKEYRSYGLRPGRHMLTTAPFIPVFDPYGCDLQREHLRDPALVREREYLRDPALIRGREHLRDPALVRERERHRDPALIREREHQRDPALVRENEYLRDPAFIREREHLRDPDLFREREDLRDPVLINEREHLRDPALVREREHLRETPLIREREHLRDTPLIREREHLRDATVVRKETIHPDPLFLSEKDYRAYGLQIRQELPTAALPTTETTTFATGTYQKDPYYPYPDDTTSLVERYLPLPRTVAAPSESSARRETYGNYSSYAENDTRNHPERVATKGSERLYSTYASHGVSDYNQNYHHLGDEQRFTSAPVSSRYSFAGPSSAPYR